MEIFYTIIKVIIALICVVVPIVGFYFGVKDSREAARKEAERKKRRAEEEAERRRKEQEEAARRQEAIDALEARIATAAAAFLKRYEDFDEDDAREERKAASKEGVALSSLYGELAVYYIAEPEVYYVHLESSYKTLLKALSIYPTSSKVRVLALERGRELAELGRAFQGNGGRVTIYDEAAIQNDLNAYGGLSSDAV